jgi:hypothetical protein
VHPTAGDVEVDGVRPGVSVGQRDRVALRSGPAVTGAGDGEHRKQLPILQRFRDGCTKPTGSSNIRPLVRKNRDIDFTR